MQSQTLKQLEIIKASVRLIGRKGLAALTTRNLSKELGVTQPIIYRHFKNKKEILAGILLFLMDNNRRISNNVVKKDVPALDRIKELYLSYFKDFKRAPALTTAIFCEELYQQDKILILKVLGIMETTREALVNILEDGKVKKEIRADLTSEQIAIIIMGTMRFAVTKWRLNKYKTDLVSQGKELCAAFRILLTAGTDNP